MKNTLRRFLSIFLVLLLVFNIWPAMAFAAHKHVGAMCGKVVKEYKQLNDKQHILVTANENLCSCGEYLGLIDVKETKQDHNFSGEKCTACGYKRTHQHKGAMSKQVKYYTNITSSKHTYVVETQDLCSCGQYLGLIDVEKTTSNHSFTNDKCTKCGYKREHVHKGAQTSSYKNESYEAITETTHTYVTSRDNLCSCGYKLGIVEEKKEVQEHTFVNNECSKCNYKKREHVHKGAQSGGHLNESYESITATTHTYVTSRDNLCSCGYKVGIVEEKKEVQEHHFVDDRCTACGYKREHVHKGVQSGAYKNETYESITATTHTYVTSRDNLCSCGYKVGIVEEKKEVQEHHFVDDRCTACGYKREHVHKGVQSGAYKNETYESITATTHTYVTSRDNLCSCGYKVGIVEEKKEVQEHHFVDDRCTACGYKREHVHKGVQSGAYKNETYESITATTHTYVTSRDNLCSCGYKVGIVEENKVVQNHNFVDDKCTQCAYKREHVHKGTVKGKTRNYYEEITSTTHTFVSGNESICSCGKYMGLTDVKRSVNNHSFKNDKCAGCGYERKHVHEGRMSGQERSIFIGNDATTHSYMVGRENLCSCGEYLGLIETKNITSNHTFKNNKCTVCEYVVNTHVHKANQCKNSKTIYTDITEKTHTRVDYEGDHFCSCGAFVTYGEYKEHVEAHNFKDGVCIYCKTSQHVHIPVRKGSTQTNYQYADEKMHVKIVVSEGLYCSCGKYMSSDDESMKFSYEEHTFSDKKCMKCGYKDKSYLEVAIEQAIAGDFSNNSNAAGTGAQVLIGEIPVIGTIADIRDLIASDSPEDFLFNLAAFVPGVGALKYTDEVHTVVKHSDDVLRYTDDEIKALAGVVIKQKDNIDDYAENLRVIERVSDSTDDAYANYYYFKKEYGAAGDGLEWHHIVEQSQAKRSGFDLSDINNGSNIIPIDSATHRKVSGYYSRIVPGTDMSFRDWIAYKGFTFEEQQKIGEYVLEMYGVKVK